MENLPTTSWTVTAIHLETTAKVPGVSGEQFATVAAGAKAGCPISRLLNAEITLDAKLI
jgi:osmotically inducible protein OsmC